MRDIIVEERNTYEEYPIGENGIIAKLELTVRTGRLYYEQQEISPYTWTAIKNCNLLYLGGEKTIYERGEKLFISEKYGDICIPNCSAKILVEPDKIVIEEVGNSLIYMNQQRVEAGTYPFEEGVVLLINQCKLIIKAESVSVWGMNYSTDLVQTNERKTLIQQFPVYKRSPRLIKRVEEKKIKIDTPPASSKMGKKGLIQMILPPLGMLAVTVAIGVLLRRGIYMLMSISATGMTLIFSVTKYVQDKKEHRITEEKKKKLYTEYLLRKRKEIYEQWTKEREAYTYNYPKIDEIEKMIHAYDNRIYERSSMDDDFLNFSVGHFMGKPAFSIEDKTNELDVETNEYLEEGKELKTKYSIIDRPQIVDLKNAHLGLVGDKSVIHEQIKLYVSQLSFMQSYHDVQFIAIYEKEYEKDFSWMRWLPHARIQSLNVLGLIGGERSRDQVLGSMQQILKDRKQRLEEGKKETRFLPHYVMVIDEPKVLMDHSIMEYLGEESLKLGVSLIYCSNQRANLPENIGTVLMLENSEEGCLLLEEKVFSDTRLHLYRLGDCNLEMMARDLGVLVHEQGMVSHIPESITFFDMYGVQNPEELQIQRRWMRNNSSKTLAVPLGARAVGDYLELNLHEKAHGPHGLVAGTTGSGKSEIVQSYILSLAVNFHPHEVGFLLIDYKGGGMANLFQNLPHLLGTITNLDGSESMRALASIQSELHRRERIFGEYGVNHINAYNDLCKENKATEPIPHLFIISDEFAELKKEQPEFMKELVSTARVGRSLGVHLILATQKPSGVVDDQIWSNSKFKLCLKVQNESDSKEVLHTADAANITQAGRAYLQVGNNEVYELFQSAWSGAMYIKETEQDVTQDDRVYLVNELGQGELINQDLRGTTAERKAKETQLDVVIAKIKEVYDMEHAEEVKKPWLPSLKDKIVNPNMSIQKSEKVDLSIDLGMLDVPEKQVQISYTVDLSRQGNIIYIASSGYGKSMFLTNAALQLASKNTVGNMNLYVLDFGNNALISLSRLPHMADYIMLDDEEKFAKFRELIVAEMSRRKKLMAESMAQNFSVYNETAEIPIKALVLLIDNYDAVKELGFEMEEYFTKITRDGSGLGIYTIITASRGNAVRYATLNNFKNKVAGFNFEENEIKTLVGRSAYTLPEVRGRAMIKYGETANIMQLYTPVDFENEISYNKNVQAYVQEVAAANKGEEAPHIPILPDELSYDSLMRYEGKGIALGLNKDTVERCDLARQNTPFLILGESGSGKTNLLKLILQQLTDPAQAVVKENIYLLDSKSMGLYTYKNQVQYVSKREEFEAFANRLSAETKLRKQSMEEGLAEGKEPKEIIREMDPLYVVMDDIDDFCEFAGGDLAIVASRIENAASFGITFIVSANTNKFKGTDTFTRFMKNTRNGVLLSNQGYLTLFPVKVNAFPVRPDGFMMLEGRGVYIRIPGM